MVQHFAPGGLSPTCNPDEAEDERSLLLHTLLNAYSMDELEAIAKQSAHLHSAGWGRLTIVFNGSHKLLEITSSLKLK